MCEYCEVQPEEHEYFPPKYATHRPLTVKFNNGMDWNDTLRIAIYGDKLKVLKAEYSWSFISHKPCDLKLIEAHIFYCPICGRKLESEKEGATDEMPDEV